VSRFLFRSLFVSAIAISSVSSVGISQVSANPRSDTDLVQNMGRDAFLQSPTAQGVTSVSQFSDVQPTDWAFTALQSLVERYGCIAGYPDKSFRGQGATTRYEFAAGLNACLDKVNELISSGLADKVGKEDLATVQKLQEQFSAELATIKNRVSALETKTATLELQQFSTTTKLVGTAIFSLASGFGDNTSTNGRKNTTLSGRVRLNFNTSFSGNDLLRIRLESGNVQNESASNLTRLGYDGSAAGNIFKLDSFVYRFPVNSQLNIVVGASGTDADDILDPVTNLQSSENGAISRFGRRDPLIFRAPVNGVGAGIVWRPSDQIAFNLAYLTGSDNASNPVSTAATTDGGVFGGGYTATLQFVYKPIKSLTFGLAYSRGYTENNSLVGSTGTVILDAGAYSSDRFGAQANWAASSFLNFGGWFSYVKANQVGGVATADIINWAVIASLPNLLSEGNEASLIFGQPPRVITTSNSVGAQTSINAGNQNPYHIEALYRFRLSRNITITPGLITILNPGTGGTAGNDPVFVGVLRTSFTF
jgi:Carbohydrate-selective porin, OprB family/S-layer homology domain